MTAPSWPARLFRRVPRPQPDALPTPIIIAGMHRSGTTMICEMLEQAGLFVGAAKDPNNEAFFFLKLNNWILLQAGLRWDTPERLPDLLGNPALREKIIGQLQRMMSAPECVEYLGRTLFQAHGEIPSLAQPWGWKDPRNTLTLPLWLSVFPRARVILVQRHGLDVAASLRERSRAVLQQWRPPRGDLGAALVVDSARCCTLEGAFSLWSEYMKFGAQHTAALTNPVHTIRFEDFLLQPEARLAELAAFCGLAAEGEQLRRIAAGARSERARSYRSQAELVRFATEVGPALRLYGYE